VIITVDASVAVKWYVQNAANEPDADLAVKILIRAGAGDDLLVQPPHFIAEVAGVLARMKPHEAAADVTELQHLALRVVASAQVYATAIELATTLQHHLFDTLYHAVALQTPGCTLVTADRVYYRKAKSLGQIQLLEDFEFA
jgi:predicted nucleic acid-binding protein